MESQCIANSSLSSLSSARQQKYENLYFYIGIYFAKQEKKSKKSGKGIYLKTITLPHPAAARLAGGGYDPFPRYTGAGMLGVGRLLFELVDGGF